LKPPFDHRQLPQAIDAARVGVSWAALAVAETGSLVEFATDDALRLVSALPRIHVGRILPVCLMTVTPDFTAGSKPP
jgi:L-lactate utilization protein LutC